MNEDEIRLNAENIRLNAEKIRLFEENNFLREMLNRLIPVPINDDLDRLNNRLNELEKKTRRIEEYGNMQSNI